MSLSYQQLLNELAGLVENRASGTLFIRSDCNHAISFTLETGRITAIYFGPRKGRKAISLILEVAGGSCNFENAGPGRLPQDLPSSQEILRLLRPGNDAPGAEPGGQPDRPVELEPEVWHRNLEELQFVLTDHLGPIAGIILDEAVTELGGPCTSEHDYRRLIDNLARNIEPGQVSRFHGQIAGILSRF